MDCTSLEKAVTLKELESILRMCDKEKSPGPYGWTVEFFLAFWDLVGMDVLAMFEEVRLQGVISGSLNSTFIALIPKKDKPITFDDFCPLHYAI